MVFVCLATDIFAQGTSSRVVGTVQDPSGLGVAGSTVTLTNEQTGVSFKTSTSQDGLYQFEAVQIGVYSLEAEAAGFKKFVSKGNQLSIGAPMTVNVTMQLGTVAEQVEVVATAELVQTSQSPCRFTPRLTQ